MEATRTQHTTTGQDDTFELAGRTYHSRLLTGTGKYRDFDETLAATEASGAEIVTVAIRRTNIGQDKDQPNLLDYLSPERFTILPNTAGCFTAEDAVRTCRLARELLDGHPWSSSRCWPTRRPCSPTSRRPSRRRRSW
jgi:thiazole synthase